MKPVTPWPQLLFAENFIRDRLKLPQRFLPRGDYHTHGGPPDTEDFSTKDRVRNRVEHIDGYLGTPGGRFRKFYQSERPTVQLWGPPL